MFPKAKLAIVALSDTQGTQTTACARRRTDITEVTFPYKPGDYVVHAAHGVAFFEDLVRREVDGTARDYLLLKYAEGDRLFVPVEQLDRVTRYVGPEGQALASPEAEHVGLVARDGEGAQGDQKARVRFGRRVRAPRGSAGVSASARIPRRSARWRSRSPTRRRPTSSRPSPM